MFDLLILCKIYFLVFYLLILCKLHFIMSHLQLWHTSLWIFIVCVGLYIIAIFILFPICSLCSSSKRVHGDPISHDKCSDHWSMIYISKRYCHWWYLSTDEALNLELDNWRWENAEDANSMWDPRADAIWDPRADAMWDPRAAAMNSDQFAQCRTWDKKYQFE